MKLTPPLSAIDNFVVVVDLFDLHLFNLGLVNFPTMKFAPSSTRNQPSLDALFSLGPTTHKPRPFTSVTRRTSSPPTPTEALRKGDLICIIDTETVSLSDRRVWEFCLRTHEVGADPNQGDGNNDECVHVLEHFAHTISDTSVLEWHAAQRKIPVEEIGAMIRQGAPNPRCALMHCVGEGLGKSRRALKEGGRLWVCAFNEPFDRSAIAHSLGSMEGWVNILQDAGVHAVVDYKSAIKWVARLRAAGYNGSRGKQEDVYFTLFGETYQGHCASDDVGALHRIILETTTEIVGVPIGRRFVDYRRQHDSVLHNPFNCGHIVCKDCVSKTLTLPSCGVCRRERK